MSASVRAWPCAWTALVVLLGGCDLAYPEVVVVNATAETVLVADPSFNGCRWSTVLAYGDATAPRACLPGEDRVHLKKLDVASYCTEQAEDGSLVGVCPCATGGAGGQPEGAGGAGGAAPGPSDPGLEDVQPRWFNYQTVSSYQAGYGEFVRVEIRASDLEQDFSIPGPYGH